MLRGKKEKGDILGNGKEKFMARLAISEAA